MRHFYSDPHHSFFLVIQLWPLSSPRTLLIRLSMAMQLRARLTSGRSLHKWDWSTRLRRTGGRCSQSWTETRADTSRRRSSSEGRECLWVYLQKYRPLSTALHKLTSMKIKHKSLKLGSKVLSSEVMTFTLPGLGPQSNVPPWAWWNWA